MKNRRGRVALASRPVIQSSFALEEISDPQRVLDLGTQIVNSGLFDWALEDLPEYGLTRVEDRHAPRLALMLYNQLSRGSYAREASALGVPSLEDIQTGDLALPTKWALPIIRRIYPAIFDAPLFATQTMPGPLAYAFYMDFKRESDGTDFRAVNPFTAFVATAFSTGTALVVKISGKANPVGLSIYQLVVGQTIQVSLGTANVETFTINAVNPATGTITLNTAATKAHAVGDIVYAPAVAALAEASVPTKGKLSLTRTPVTANKWMLAATWSTEAMEDARAQLNLDIEGEMVQALSVEIGRELFSTIVGDILQGATGGATSIPLRGANTATDYKLLANQPVVDAEAQIYARRFHDADTLLCGLDLASNLQQQDTFHMSPADESTMSQLGFTHLGTYQNKFQVYKSVFLPPNLGLIFKKPTDWLHAGYVYMPYIPLSPMPLVYAGYNSSTGNYINSDEWTRNIRTRAGRLLTVSDEYGLITQS